RLNRNRRRFVGFAASGARHADEFVNLGRGRHTLRDDRSKLSETEGWPGALADRVADQDRGPIFLVQPFEPGGEVHRRAEYRVVHPLRGADIADNDVADMYSDADDKRS